MNFLITKILSDNLRSEKDFIPNNNALLILNSLKEKKIIAIRSSMGFGKSTLLSHFVTRYEAKYSFYKLDPDDNNLYAFLHYLINSIDNAVPGFKSELTDLLNFYKSSFIKKDISSKKQVFEFANAIINRLYTLIKEPFYMIFDGAEFISSYMWANTFLEYIIENSSSNIHLIFTSANALPFNEDKFKLKRIYGELTNIDLRAEKETIRKIADKVYSIQLTSEQASKIAGGTGGWITGIHIFLQTMSSNSNAPEGKDLSVLMNYFFEKEILDHLDKKYVKTLILSSLIDNLDTDMMSFLFKEINSKDLTELLRTKYGFIIRSGIKGEIEYLEYFKLFLFEKCKSHFDDKIIKNFYSKAANYHLVKNDHLTGAKYLLSAGDYKKLIPLYLQKLPELNRNGDLDIAERWLRSIPQDSEHDVPELSYFRGLLYKNYYQDFTKAEDQFEKFLSSSKTGTDEYYIKAVCHIAEIRNSQGKTRSAIKYLEKFRSTKMPVKQLALLLFKLSSCYIYSNELTKAQLCCNEAIDIVSKVKDPESKSTKASLLNNLGNIKYMNSEYSESKVYYERSLKDMTVASHRIQTGLMLSNVNLYTGDFNDSLIQLDILTREPIANEIPELKIQLREAFANYYLEKGDLKLCLKEIGILAAHSEQLENNRVLITALAIQSKVLYYSDDIPGLKKCLQKVENIRPSGLENDIMVCDLINAVIKKDQDKAEKCQKYFEDNNLISDKIYSLLLVSEIEMKKKNKNGFLNHFDNAFKETLKTQNYNSFINTFRFKRELIDFAIKSEYSKDNIAALNSIIISRIDEGYIDEEEYIVSDISVITSGVPAIYIRGEKVDEKAWKRNKFKEMFIYLFLNKDNYVTKDILIDEFFPGSETAYSDNIFHQFLSALRSIFHKKNGIEYINYENKIFSFNEGYIYYSDYVKFTSLLKRTGSLKDKDPLKETILKKSIDMYNDIFMKGYYNPWVEDLRVRVDSIKLKFINYLIKILEANGDFDGILKYNELMLKQDELDEDLNLKVIGLYASDGDINTAKIKYKLMLEKFKKELGEEPSPQFLKNIKEVLLY
ncbi:hypothetical protein BH10BAC5_BH10BAC5_12410 [soil metagenome]